MTPSKFAVFEHILADGYVWVHFDARKPGVIVPKHLRDRANVAFTFGYGMPVPIHDLSYDGHSVSGTLSFDGCRFHCTVPWDAVFGIRREDGMGAVWTSSMPPDALEEPLEQKPGLRLVR